LDNKRQNIFNDWLKTWTQYIQFEKSFNPSRLRFFKRGDIILAHFGYNIGNELGGTHYAVVVENNNNSLTGIITVIPISSLDSGQNKNLHKSEVFLGSLINNTECYAMPLQIRSISKLRIIKPKYSGQAVTTISNCLLNEIDVTI
jgi:mRNA-degrading endonuclease toxin of MazEF toxin-antitoxin module